MNQSIQAHLRELAVLLVVFGMTLLGSPATWAQSQLLRVLRILRSRNP